MTSLVAPQVAESEMYRVNREKQAAAVEWQRERHALEAQLAAAEQELKNTAAERDRVKRECDSLNAELREERDANQELVHRLNDYAREMGERDREHNLRRAQELRQAEEGVQKAILSSEDAAMRAETLHQKLMAEVSG